MEYAKSGLALLLRLPLPLLNARPDPRDKAVGSTQDTTPFCCASPRGLGCGLGGMVLPKWNNVVWSRCRVSNQGAWLPRKPTLQNTAMDVNLANNGTAEAGRRAKRRRGSGAPGMAGADDDISRQASRRKAGGGHGVVSRANNGMRFMQRIGGAVWRRS